MQHLRRILRDPLAHFLIAGALIYAVFVALAGPRDPRSMGERVIVADKAALVTFMQYRSSAFEPGAFAAQYDALSADERDELADAYIREEAMVREARALGLDASDYVIRQRLVQKMLFLVDSAESGSGPGEAALAAYFAQHRDEYALPGELTFTHVFVDDEKQHSGGGEAAARRLLAQLNARQAQFNDAPAYGDRFAFLQNYVGRGSDFVANQFGQDFAAKVSALEPADKWQGPIRSDYGWHLVLLAQRKPGGVPALAEVREQVLGDYRQQAIGARRDKAIDELLEDYDIRRDYASAE